MIVTSKIFTLFLISFLSVSVSFADEPAAVDAVTASIYYETTLNQAVEDFYQTRWNRADSLLAQLMLADENDPRSYFFSSMIPFWSYFFAGNHPEDAREFMNRSERAIEAGLYVLNVNPADSSVILMLSGLYGYRSLVAANEKNYRTAIQSGLRGYSYTRKMLSMNESGEEALIGQGIFNYMVGTIPGEIRWMTSLAGISGDKKNGIAMLEVVAESNLNTSNDARMILYYIYDREEEPDKALSHLNILSRKYPDNVIFHYHRARILDEKGEINLAREIYLRVLELPDSGLEALIKISHDRAGALSEK